MNAGAHAVAGGNLSYNTLQSKAPVNVTLLPYSFSAKRSYRSFRNGFSDQHRLTVRRIMASATRKDCSGLLPNYANR